MGAVSGPDERATELTGEVTQAALLRGKFAGNEANPHGSKRIILDMPDTPTPNPVPFATQAWADAFRAAINNSPTYQAAARQWEGDFWFIVDAEGDMPSVPIYLDLWHGECRLCEVAVSEAARKPEFRIAGSRRAWQRVASREIDPIRALMTGTLKIKGSMGKIMRNVKAAQELVLCASAVSTAF